MGGTYYDVVNEDAQSNPRAVTSVTIGARDASFLMKGGSGGGGDTVAPNTTATSPANGSSVRRGTISIRGGAPDSVGWRRCASASRTRRRARGRATPRGAPRNQPSPTSLTGSANASWTYRWTTSLTGRFLVQATAQDAAGNADATPATSTFTVTS